jgi:tetratricopeptide (TPR) repeat protein
MSAAVGIDARLRARLLATIAQHQRGDLAAAVAGYRDVLAQEPRSFDAQRLLGAALLALGRCEEAVAQFDRALAIRSDFAEVWALRADALARLNNHEAAAASFERGLALRPDDAAGWNNLGLQWIACRRFEPALAALDRAVALAPEAAVAWTNRGIAQGHLGHFTGALQSHARALQLAPQAAPIWCNQGRAQLELGDHDAAIASFDRALQLVPPQAPEAAAARTGRAAVLRALGRSEEALDDCAQALAVRPDAAAWALQGAVLADLQRTADALESFDRALGLAPEDAETRFNRGLALLTLGRFEAGWEDYEWRHHVPRLSTGGVAGIPRWDGAEPLAGRSLLLTCEQGLGDAIQFCRLIPLLADRGARVVLAAPPALRPLLDGMQGLTQVLTLADPLPPVDLQCHLLSVPQRLRLTLEQIPARTPYLRVAAADVQRWRARLDAGRPGHASPRPRIGIACSGNPRHANDRQRSIPLAHLAPLIARLRAGGCEWHLVQDAVRAEDEPWLRRLDVVDHRQQLGDLRETAALACCMDAVVSVDTAVAHLAGALGRPLFLLLPVSSDWRWLLERTDSPWYPGARLFRQRERGQWEEPLTQLGDVLVDRLGCAGPAAAAIASPGTVQALLAGAAELQKSGQYSAAIGLCREVLRHDAGLLDAHRLLAAALIHERRHAEALVELEAALDLCAQEGEVWSLQGRALAELGRRAEALRSLERALSLLPDRASVWTEHGHLLQDLGRPRDALASFARAVQLEPDDLHGQFHLANAELAVGDYAAGWARFEVRRQLPELRMRAASDCPFWDGRSALEGRRLFVCAEQGLGDTIQMSRLAPLLAARGARVVLGVQPPLAPLLRSLDGVERVVADGESLPSVDLQCWIMSLPHLLETTVESVPAQVPYLRADPARVAHWRSLLAHTAGGARPRHIGLALRGNPRQVNDRHRSLGLETFAAAIGAAPGPAAAGIRWHLLQPQIPAEDERWMQALGIADHRAALHDFGETAALASWMDAVVCVDTSVAHLAGALGLPVYVLLAANADWRWTNLRADSAWYPTARLLRQPALGDWAAPLERLRTMLTEIGG